MENNMEEYRRLGFYVLAKAVYDYYYKIRQGQDLSLAEKQLDINDVWFDVTNTNKEWFMEKVLKEGEELWQKIQKEKLEKKTI
jgi:hypothetical protein